MIEKIKLGISSCLLGNEVRYDGGHKRDYYLTDTLGQYVVFVPVCPEVECGLPVPREPMRLVGDPKNPKLVTTRTGIDLTGQMNNWIETRLEQLSEEALGGFIFKKGSPSSGMLRVKVYNEKGMPSKTGSGLFAKAFTDRFPLIPTEEEGRLRDPELRDNFVERIFALRRWRSMIEKGKTLGGLVSFHSTEKLLLMSHSPKHYRAMGKLVADGKKMSVDDLFQSYEKSFMEALAIKATPAKHVNVLQHIMGYFKKDINKDEKRELLDVIEQYRAQYIPLIVPLTLLNHYVRKYKKTYLSEQTYLNPRPIALQLRNHV